MARSSRKVSKFAILIHVILTLCTGGLWLIPLAIWYLLSNSK